MCCFSKPVKLVADTNIFARSSVENRQFLVYSMHVNANEELAMILPIPTPKNPKEDAVRFINLEKYPNFFAELRSGFPEPPAAKADGSRSLGLPHSAPATLKVVEVGSFIASFVPAIKDFSRLDERFRLPTDVWDSLPQYKDWSFAVFQLKKGEHKIHPMAFEFPRRNPEKIFFPTVHIHDGTVPKNAKFDHMLFCQLTGGEIVTDWEESPQLAESFMRKIDEAKGIVAGSSHVYRKRMQGVHKNQDTVI
jgi:hypothetical protein